MVLETDGGYWFLENRYLKKGENPQVVSPFRLVDLSLNVS